MGKKMFKGQMPVGYEFAVSCAASDKALVVNVENGQFVFLFLFTGGSSFIQTKMLKSKLAFIPSVPKLYLNSCCVILHTSLKFTKV